MNKLVLESSAPTRSRGGPAARRLSPRLRSFVLTAHVIVSVGWLGVVVAALVLAINAATARDPALSRAAYAAIGEILGTLVAPPPASFSLAALLTGLVLSVGTKWGLLQHRWIVAKLALTVAVILSGILFVDGWVRLATAADARGTAPMFLIYASLAHLLMLGAATAISVYKPWGRTARGRRALREAGLERPPSGGRAGSKGVSGNETHTRDVRP